MAVGSHFYDTILLTIPFTIPFSIFIVILQSPPVKLELFTEDGINKQLAKTREHPWSDTTLALEMAKPKQKKKGRGRGRGKQKARKDPQQDTPSKEPNFDPGIELFIVEFLFQNSEQNCKKQERCNVLQRMYES